MATLFRCVQGHQFEDTFDESSLVEAEVRCPQCGFPSFACKPTSEHNANTESFPAPPPKQHTAQATASLPQPNESPITVVHTALAEQAALDAELSVPPSRRLPRARPSEPATGPDFSPRPAPNIPGYEILGELGRGGMGVVYKARQVGLNRVVAIKMILAGSAADDRERGRFRSEGEAIARLQHPNIVQVFEIGEHEGSPWFSLEFVDGGSLADKMLGEPIAVHEAARLIETLAAAMHFAHEHGVVHRDLKPANVLLHREEHASKTLKEPTGSTERKKVSDAALVSPRVVPKITDFGLAKTLDADIHHTRSGMVVGTPSYMAPEQATHGIGVGPATDIYALGVMLYQAVTGRLPFIGDTPMEIMIRLTQQEPPPPRRYVPKLARDLETIILKCLEKDPRRRYATAQDLADDLKRFLAHEPIQARPVGKAERAVRWVRRRPTTAAMLAVGFLVVVGLLGTLAAQEQKEIRRKKQIRQDLKDALNHAEAKKKAKEWSEIPALLDGPRKVALAEPTMSDLARLLDALDREAVGHVEARQKYHAFNAKRARATFLASQQSGYPTSQQLQETRQALLGALKVVGASEKELPSFDDSFESADQSEIRIGCFELLLTLADTVARRPSDLGTARHDGAREALAILDHAAKLDLPTPAFHLRRARLLDAVGKAEEAAAARRLAHDTPADKDFDHYLLGIEHLRDFQLAKAETSFLAALRTRPNDFWPTYYLALTHIYQQRLIAARDNLTACLAQSPDEVRILLLRAYVHGQLRQFEEARKDFQSVIVTLGTNAENEARYVLYNNRAVTYLDEKKYDEALKDLGHAIALNENGYPAYVTMAKAFEKKDRPDAALIVLSAAISLAESLHRRGELDSASLAPLIQWRYRMRLGRGEVTEARADLNWVIRLGMDGLPAADKAKLLKERGHGHLRANNLDAALTDYDAAAKLDPKNPDFERWRGEVFLQRRQFEKALSAYDRYLELGGKRDASVLTRRALSLMHLKEFDRAALGFTMALEAKPNDARLIEQRGRAYLAGRVWEPAVRDFDRAIQLSPTAEAHQSRGFALLSLERAAEARADFDKAIQLKPTAEAFEGRAQAWLKLDRPRDAARDSEQLAEFAAGSAARLYSAALLLTQAGHVQEVPRTERARWHARALKLLDQSLQATKPDERPAFWREKVDKVPAMRTLRDRPDYAGLERRYATSAARP